MLQVSGQSSTESSSGSTSDSSTTSSSSSGSDSSSSSDSDTSTSRSSKPQSETEQPKKPTPIQKGVRKSTENKPTVKKNVEQPAAKARVIPAKLQKQLSKSNIYSSEDEHPNAKPVSKAPIKRKLVPKPKPVTGKNGNTSMVNKSIIQASKGSIGKNIMLAVKTGTKGVPVKTIAKGGGGGKSQNKNKEKTVKSMKNIDKSDLNKKKSIFSPENSSESENDSKNSMKIKSTPAKPRPKATAKAIEKPKIQESKLKSEIKAGPKAKAVVSSASSATTSSESNSSSSDSETSMDSSSSRKDSAKKPVKKLSQKEMNSDSDPDILNSKQVTRKSTRSASTRKSKHVLGKPVYSDTDSDTESTKRSLSRSPVKRAPIVTKGKTKNKKTDVKRSNEIMIEERVCPIENCNSLGHLGGKLDKHFTVDACPNYHNYAITDCKDLVSIRNKIRFSSVNIQSISA